MPMFGSIAGAESVLLAFDEDFETQVAMAEAEAIALASDPDTSAKRWILQNVIMTSTGLPEANVTVEEAYRCGDASTYTSSATSCATGTVMSSFVKIRVTDTLNPTWTKFGLGAAVQFDQTRYVLYKQATKA